MVSWPIESDTTTKADNLRAHEAKLNFKSNLTQITFVQQHMQS